MKQNGILNKGRTNEKYLQVFFAAFFIFFIAVLPMLIYNKGIFLYYGDYNAQQIPFSYLLHKAIRSGEIGWNWTTDLGSDLMTSYSFYLFGSPFFWLTIPFPDSTTVYFMPILLCLKNATAALTAYAYIRRFVRSQQAAFVGGLLYAFSGFQLFNIFFNHFHDVTALFPLMLIAMEEHINCNRKGVFALSVALMACVNYFFFTGQAVFLVIYYLVRCGCKDFNTNLKKFITLCAEALIGTMMAGVILVPSALALLGNYRISERLLGYDLVAYNDKLRIIRIIQSFFMLPDVPARPNLFSSATAKWASIGGYLPMFSMAGVISFMRAKKKHWANKLTLICIFMAFVPILNSAFYMFNSSYYARWYYMPILIMALMTAYALDNKQISFKTGFIISALALVCYAIVGVLPSKVDDKEKLFSLPEWPFYFWLTLALTIIMLIMLFVLLRYRAKHKDYLKKAVTFTIIACIISNSTVVTYCVSAGPYPEPYIENTLGSIDAFELEDNSNGFWRADANNDNFTMLWGYPSMRCFHSVVNTSIMEFYDSIDVQRDVASRPEHDVYAIRGLLSVQYYFDTSDDGCEMPGFEYYGKQGNFDIYKNEYYVPMGFTYDYYITKEQFDKKTDSSKDNVLMKAILLSDMQIAKYGDILENAPENFLRFTSEGEYLNDCEDRAAVSCYDFVYDSSGFTAKIDLESDELVFFSVPFDKGFEATVNGNPVQIEKVNNGFMAVRVPKGMGNVIEFSYRTHGLNTGIAVSVTGIVLFAVYLIVYRLFKDPKDKFASCHYYDYDTDITTASVSYEKAQLAMFEEKLQSASEEASKLPQEDTSETDDENNIDSEDENNAS